MAQLPPKAPTMTHHHHHNWPAFPNYHQMLPMQPPAAAAPPPFWVDEFLDFSSTRRNSHRRSVSDPIAFAEVQFADECINNNNSNSNIGFERLDDEQLCSMFADEVPPAVPSSSNPSTNDPSTPSDEERENDEEKVTMQLKKEPAEVESQTQFNLPADKDAGETIISDPKRVKR